jgi:hypothetical protein
MPATTEINISQFDELQSVSFDPAKKYLPLGESVLDQHQFGSQILGLIKTISGGVHNSENIFNLELDSGYAVAVYGFTVALNKSGVPCVLFGNSESGSNEFPISVEVDPDDRSNVFKVGNADIEFEQNSKTKQIETFVGYKKIRVRARGLFVENLNYNRLMSSANINSLSECLTVIPSGGNYGYKLKDLVHPDAIMKGNTFPMKLNVESADELYVGDAFTSRNLNVSSADGSTVWAVDKNGVVGECTKISIYNSMTAGFICEDLGVARLALCQLFQGTVQLVVIAPKNLKNPSHNLQLLAPADEKLALAYKKAKEELVMLASNGESYSHLLKPEAVKKFLNGGSEPAKKELVAAKAASKKVEAVYPDKSEELVAAKATSKKAQIETTSHDEEMYEEEMYEEGLEDEIDF